MKKTITIIAMGLMLFSLASALQVYSGDCKSIDISALQDPTNIGYVVIGNSSNTDGMNVANNNTHVSVCFDINYKSDNLSLVFFDKATKEIIKIVYQGGGGGSSTKYVDKNVTVYEPIYINKTITSEPGIVEKIVEKIVYQDTGYDLWMIFLAMATGAAVVWIMMRGKGDGKRIE